MAGTPQDWDSDFKDYDGSTQTGNTIDNKIENVIATIEDRLQGSFALDGSTAAAGALPIKRLRNTITVSSANYTITDADRVSHVLVTTGASDRTITLPTAADNEGVELTITKVDAGAGHVIVDGEGAEVIYNQNTSFASIEIWLQFSFITIICDGTQWIKINSPCLHFLDESDRSSSWLLNVNPTTSWAEADLSAYVPPGTLAIYGLMSIVLADADGIILLRDGTSSETNQTRTLSLGNFSSAGNTLRVPLTIKATNGIFDYAEFSAAAELSTLSFLLWGWQL
jgi:hypothetical protein